MLIIPYELAVTCLMNEIRVTEEDGLHEIRVTEENL